ncbi:MAG: hypothetical protein Q9201_001834 [Fulgogasparrea decipioides]
MSLCYPYSDDDPQPQGSTGSIIKDDRPSIISRKGRLVPLRTKTEIEHDTLQTVSAYVVEVPQKSANNVLKAVDALILKHATAETINIQHLRRIIKPEHLPLQLRRRVNSCPDASVHARSPSLALSPEEVMGGFQRSTTELTEQPNAPILFLLISATSSIPRPFLSALLSSLLSFHSPTPIIVQIPLHPPTSAHQAQEWSTEYWPTIYKNNNPFGPQPSFVSRAESELLPSVGKWMSLALATGREAKQRGMGIGAGAVIAEKGHVVVAAGDGRWIGGESNREGNGNPMAHAVMRAIGLIARKRRELLARQTSLRTGRPGEHTETDSKRKQKASHFADMPLTDVEAECFERDSIVAGGYLCLDLDIIITHEPCVMCSMAILHSRFGRVVFGQRVPQTGGLSAEVKDGGDEGQSHDKHIGGLGYGLFWRPELNWKLLGWQWEDETRRDYGPLIEETHI